MKKRGNAAGRLRRAALLLLTAVMLAATGHGFAVGNLVLPESTLTVKEEAFYKDQSLSVVTLPEGLKRIESLAFAYSSVTWVNLPDSLEFIADDAFEGCTSNLMVTASPGTEGRRWAEKKGYALNTPIYRALLIGEEHFGWDTATRNRRDMEHMAAMLGTVQTPVGTAYEVIRRTDLKYSGVKAAINEAFSDSTKEDVCLFFIATHGNSDGDGELATLDYSIGFDELAAWLKSACKGKVIVILESCGAGSAIYAKGAGAAADPAAAAEAFVRRAVQAFSAADEAVERIPKGLAANSTGDLRVENKFYVLAAAAHHEESFGYEDWEDEEGNLLEEGGNLFTEWLLEGIGASADNAPADTPPEDGALTLKELYNYVKLYDKKPLHIEDETFYQHVQVYPASSPGWDETIFLHR